MEKDSPESGSKLIKKVDNSNIKAFS